MRKKHKRHHNIRVFRNSDAQKFLDMARFRKRQEREIERMNASFYDTDYLDVCMAYAIAKGD